MIRYLPDGKVDRRGWPNVHRRADYPEWPDYDELANAIDAANERIRELDRERQENAAECAKAEKLWKQEAIRAERAETTCGGLERAGEILLARAEAAEAALAEARAWQAKAFLAHPNLDLDIDAAIAREGK